jgi:hypothetical protein
MDPKLIAALAVVIGAIARASKEDVAWFPNIPKQYRPSFVLGLGVLAAASQALAAGVDWKDALLTGLLASSGAMVGHVVGVEGMLGGKEPTVAMIREAWDKDGAGDR